ncbi:MAG: hypothetical protein HY518_01320 [Candidatus Aenigmarchaeota archaeon]|nr:hypothetical protein [Candidatus Aenigmarchaeota archaeon]
MIIALVGRRASGKDTAAQYLEGKYGFKHYDYTRDVLAPILEKQNKPMTRENLVSLAMSLRKKTGNAAPTMLICRRLKAGGDYVISGVRFPEEVEYFRELFGREFILVAVIAAHKARHRRAVSRNIKGEGSLSYKEFLLKESLPTEIVLDRTMRTADCRLSNTGSIRDLHWRIDLLIQRIKYLHQGDKKT